MQGGDRASEHSEGRATIRVMSVIWPRQGLSQQEFLEHYEDVHAPLILRLTRGMAAYKRHYLRTPVASSLHPSKESVPPAVINEVTFFSAADYSDFLDSLAQPDVAALIVNDEASFIDRERTLSFLVEERVSEISRQQSQFIS